MPEFQNRYGQGWGFANSLLENGSWGPKLDGVERLWGHIVDGEQLYKPYSAQKNNMKDFYETGVQTDNSLAISGGKGKLHTICLTLISQIMVFYLVIRIGTDEMPFL